MDWTHVSGEELLEALREVEWAVPPRSPKEFFAKFTPPRSASRWTSRLKCNVYFYRTNYAILLALVLAVAFFRNPLALVALSLLGFTVMCLNDPFATSVSETIMQLVRKFNPQLAAKMRNAGHGNLNLSSSRKRAKVFMCGCKRTYVVMVLSAVSLLLIYISSALLTISGALVLAFGVIFFHASMRTPNLKARLASAREEFRAVWRGYNDYTI
mmetsp:Transcript_25793/g.48939  ORF Transcript_25793/g.48939 Transcript_25793/m.48939 type:complete len:213 (+) Transcript_25793:237-875(+)|eukprot:CAMPEP_0114237838 /NCGR_PEP_ID=MMETSP0058-20121206/7605_1 /TAXON_ID=36894 /ORGANISM="Pyramimonas parkeae, CCMP726" /LENGTH=212 /DNA_ID=CAMNT_0001349909 /DNA_START=235 /DNA_END=873 /DNA_ORIENTATION=+